MAPIRIDLFAHENKIEEEYKGKGHQSIDVIMASQSQINKEKVSGDPTICLISGKLKNYFDGKNLYCSDCALNS